MSNEKIKEFETTVIIRLTPDDLGYFERMHGLYLCNTKDDVTFGRFLAMCLHRGMSQHMHENAKVYALNDPVDFEVCEYCDNALISEDLTSDDDYSASVVGYNGSHGYRMCLSSGWGRSLRLEGEKYYEGWGWQIVSTYFPKYCPECGRKITEVKR